MKSDYKLSYDFALKPGAKASLPLPFLNFGAKDGCGIYEIKVLKLSTSIPTKVKSGVHCA